MQVEETCWALGGHITLQTSEGSRPEQIIYSIPGVEL